MNNQMDKAKFLKWLDSEDAAVLWEGPEGLMKYDMLVETINADEFAPDVPTIKPGIHVRITDAMDPRYIGMGSTVEYVSNYSPVSVKLKGMVGDWPLSSLEVVE